MAVDSELHASWEARGNDTTLTRAIRRVRVSLLAEHSGLAGRHGVRRLVSLTGLVGRLDAIAARPDARLQRHRGPTPAQETLLSMVDPRSLPFDPESAGARGQEARTEPADTHGGRAFRIPMSGVVAAVWKRVTGSSRRAA
jgi:hypothetical protein